MASQTYALEAYSLTRSRRTAADEACVWRSPDIVVRSGEFAALLAEQASDEQVVLGVLSGLLDPTGGVIRIAGQSVEEMDRPDRAAFRARRVGFLFRSARLLADVTVLQNVLLPSAFNGKTRSENKARALQLLMRLGLQEMTGKKPGHLSALQAQQVSLARALLNQPVLVLADEPTDELSAQDANVFLKQLRDICSEEGVAILLGTTRPEWASQADATIPLPAHGGIEYVSTGDELTREDLLSDIYDTDLAPMLRPVAPLLDLVVKPLLYTGVVAVVIVFLTFFSLRMARAGRSGVNVNLVRGAGEALDQSAEYLKNLLHGELGSYPPTAYYYYWSQPDKQVADEVARTLPRSLALLLLSMVLGAVIGVPLGLAAAVVRHRRYSLVFLVMAIIGVSTPSFFLALLLQILEINIYKRTGVALVPVGGFGWDRHIILPAMVLAARPIAQVARVSFVALAQILDADYVRTARAKGLTEWQVISGHALRNAGVSILTALGASMRFSLSSLPVVEAIFQWGGMGALLLDAVRSGNANLAATLTLILGVFFVLIHVVLDHLYHWVDPRLREQRSGLRVARSWVDMFSVGWGSLQNVADRIGAALPWKTDGSETRIKTRQAHSRPVLALSEEQRRRDAKIRAERRRAWVQSTAGSLPFMLGTVVLIILLVMVVVGQRIAPHSPFSPVPSYTNEAGQLVFAPYPPSERFPLGSDSLGRDIWTLLLYGARRTLSLAFFAVVARVLVGTILGALSGWFPDSLLDRALMGLNQVIAAFPSLLLAMVLIYAFGISQGLWVFALALCLTGWGEVAQSVRGYVMSIRDQDYVEGAQAVGLGDLQLLTRHVLPNLVPSLVVLGCLEMGGVLMTLGELGFIGVFIGGGMSVATVSDTVATYFDIPEWGVMLSTSWRSFRSQPWMTFYPALAFTLAILGFNLFGEGLRRLTERLTLTMHRIINRYTIGAALGLGALMLLAAEGTGSWAEFSTSANSFSADRAMADVSYLASEELNGRGADTSDLEQAANFIAAEFAALELQPASATEDGTLTYFSRTFIEHRSLEATPSLQLADSSGGSLMPLTYRTDFVEMPDAARTQEGFSAEIVCVGVSREAAFWPEGIGLAPSDIARKVILVADSSVPSVIRNVSLEGAILVIAPTEDHLTRRELVASPQLMGSFGNTRQAPVFYISQAVAERILGYAGYTLEQVQQSEQQLGVGDGFVIRTGVQATVDIQVSEARTSQLDNVQAFIPGSDNSLDNELVMLIASYDGQGRDLDGTLYPGANKNASGVAVMLEVARVLKENDYQPRRTVMFVAWAGGDLHTAPDFWGMLRQRPGFLEQYRIVAAIDLVGVGSGTTDTLLIDYSSSSRLTEALQQAARRSGVTASTLGSGVHGVYGNLYQTPEKKIPYISVTWAGSGVNVHTPQDSAENLQVQKIQNAGRVAALVTMYLGHEKEY
jgi:ABC-type dipeptide/oligopeptide/nickel transport system permease subunit/ABC-type lipoprotein export system ATPase subunit